MATVVEEIRSIKTSDWRKAVPVVLLIVGWFSIGWLVRGFFRSSLDPETALLKEAHSIILEKAYGDLPSSRQLTYAAIQGMLDSTGDPYAAFYEPQLAAHNRAEMQGAGAVIGLRGEMRAGQFVVTQVTPGEPAEQAGVRPGDILLEIDGWQVRPEAEYMQVMTMIRGPEGSTARLVVRRGEETLTFEAPRKAVPEVNYRMISGEIAYLRFDQFTETTPAAVENALQNLLAEGPSGLILDLRYNGGGRMQAAQEILDLFLEQGTAFYAQMKNDRRIVFPTKSGDLAEEIPLVVLIGHDTYSAPETLAASIADHRRGTLIGETTYGKGSIKETITLEDGSAVQITVARWMSPVNRETFEGRGVEPDTVVTQEADSDGDTVLDYAVDFLKNR